MSRTYTVVLDPDPEEGGYTVTVPALPGVVTQGDTVEQCIERVREAIALHLAAMAEDGEPIPRGAREASPGHGHGRRVGGGLSDASRDDRRRGGSALVIGAWFRA